MRTFLLLLFLLVPIAAFAAGLSFEQAKAKADKDEASLSAVQTQQLITSQGKAGGEAHSICLSANPKSILSPYTVVMELDASGKIVRTWLRGDSALAICFKEEMSRRTLFIPPHAPFFTSFEMSWKP